MSLLDDLEDEDVDSKPQPSGKFHNAAALILAVLAASDRGKIYSESQKP